MVNREIFDPIGFDEVEVLARFGNNQAMMWSFIKKFPKDETFAAIERAYVGLDYLGIERAAHTLKGISGNLGFKKLYESCDSLVQCVRQGDTDLVNTKFELLKAEYTAVLGVLAQLEH